MLDQFEVADRDSDIVLAKKGNLEICNGCLGWIPKGTPHIRGIDPEAADRGALCFECVKEAYDLLVAAMKD